uniref:Uncharacterized protein n=1 Tax=Zea mays TaxID=4577 RepID=C0PJZ0_MAIZE|nr:unknown [Zea mays]
MERDGVAVLAGVADDEGGGVGAAALHLLPRPAVLVGAAPVVSARVRRPLDRLLPVLAPRPGVRRRAHGHPRHLLLARLALLLFSLRTCRSANAVITAVGSSWSFGRRRRFVVSWLRRGEAEEGLLQAQVVDADGRAGRELLRRRGVRHLVLRL